MRGVYIASIFKDGTFDPHQQMSLISFDKGGYWQYLDVSTAAKFTPPSRGGY